MAFPVATSGHYRGLLMSVKDFSLVSVIHRSDRGGVSSNENLPFWHFCIASSNITTSRWSKGKESW